ncbi:MAG: enoyl-CoA hydratase-related protein [Spongiibacteraceae bacterium]
MSVLLRRREGAVEILTLNRPEQRNALSPELIAALGAALGEIANSNEVSVVILTAAGDRAFCAGMDLKAFAEAAEKGIEQNNSNEYFDMFAEGRYPKPLIAAVNATAVAGGFELVMNCDLAVVNENAKFGIPEAKRGLFAAGGGVLLPARIPLAVALEMGLTGEPISAQRAYDLGLVNRVVKPEAIIPTALELAQQIAANGPLGVAATKRLMWACTKQGVEAALQQMKAAIDPVFKSEDAIEGSRAFAEKRPPQWKGR